MSDAGWFPNDARDGLRCGTDSATGGAVNRVAWGVVDGTGSPNSKYSRIAPLRGPVFAPKANLRFSRRPSRSHSREIS
jgi:hypothetical protein